MKTMSLLTLAAFTMLSSASAYAGSGHSHGKSAHDHGASMEKPSHDAHASGKAGDFASTEDAMKALKAALTEADEATKNNKLEAIHEIYPRIEGAAAYVHDYAKAPSQAIADRFHASVDQMMALVSEMHDTSHGLNKEETARLLKKANGAVMLVENYLSVAADTKKDTAADHGHSHGSHGHAH
jgi:hypothetical protein